MKKSCCFTGHRPEKLDISIEELEARLKTAIDEAVKDGFTTFITGMAPGTDLIAGKAVLDLNNPDIKLICAVPFPKHIQPLSDDWKEIYRCLLENATEVHYVSDEYSRQCFQLRDEWMVDRSDMVIAVYNGTRGGTRNTILYANKKGVPVRQLLEVRNDE